MPFTQCACDDDYPTKTLAQLRAEVIAGLGFVDVKAAATRTLGNLRSAILRRLGMAAQLAALPPGVSDLVDDFINEAQAAVYRRYPYDAYGTLTITTMAADSDATAVDGEAVFLLALANAKSHFEQDAKPYYDQFNAYLQDLFTRQPPNLTGVVNRIVKEAQELLYQRHTMLRQERWFSWTLSEGERYYDLPDNDEQQGEDACTKTLDPNRITWVGVSQDMLNWRPLTCGIDPTRYGTDITGIPDSYDIRQCIEIWPAPSDDSWTLRIKGRFGLLPFTDDAHTTTIDPRAITLLALANAKAHYNQPDAGNYMGQLTTYLGDLCAGTHLTRRYVPGKRDVRNAVPPKMVP